MNVTSDKPFYLMLGESYDNNWHAYLNGRELPHFYAYSFQNGYYINETGTISIIIKYNGHTWRGKGYCRCRCQACMVGYLSEA